MGKSSIRYRRVGVLSLLLLVGLGGCALSPQTVTLSPLIDVGVPQIGHGRVLALTVTDQRPRQSFGSRGGIYGATATIRPGGNVAQTLRRALAERLRAAGFRVVAGAASNGLQLAVQIHQIHYQIKQAQGLGGTLVNNVQVTVQINATVHSGSQSSSGQYQASSVRQVLGYPSAADNATMINVAVDRALRQLLQDPQLLSLLRQ